MIAFYYSNEMGTSHERIMSQPSFKLLSCKVYGPGQQTVRLVNSRVQEHMDLAQGLNYPNWTLG
eukprot:CAMPEP_0113535844 /NCGR_PEP_ID=MMETSP0015_2-20120614/5934_1 /TAXON_ID=2838 /ORGANISM="Odontella" /LENGTH=63 /DNA_ID=CAMNT_0000435149 /DNA_START=165 /DNA_END=356 /DNA_ORIENTATION=+ /assembly_acc=CAM_ASM_000160